MINWILCHLGLHTWVERRLRCANAKVWICEYCYKLKVGG